MFGKFFKTPGTIIKQIARQRDVGTKFTKERILMIPPIFSHLRHRHGAILLGALSL
jgi:hypothetical protein